jgi:hypothetical protein
MSGKKLLPKEKREKRGEKIGQTRMHPCRAVEEAVKT